MNGAIAVQSNYEGTINTFLSFFLSIFHSVRPQLLPLSLDADKQLKSKAGKESFTREKNHSIYSDVCGGG